MTTFCDAVQLIDFNIFYSIAHVTDEHFSRLKLILSKTMGRGLSVPRIFLCGGRGGGAKFLNEKSLFWKFCDEALFHSPRARV